MASSFLPDQDQDLEAWAANFDTRITATPTAFGLVAGDATAFHALAADFTAKLAGPAPTTPEDARFSALVTRFRGNVPIPGGSNGKTLWVLAQWYNLRGELGPVSAVASTTIAA